MGVFRNIRVCRYKLWELCVNLWLVPASDKWDLARLTFGIYPRPRARAHDQPLYDEVQLRSSVTGRARASTCYAFVSCSTLWSELWLFLPTHFLNKACPPALPAPLPPSLMTPPSGSDERHHSKLAQRNNKSSSFLFLLVNPPQIGH